MCQRQNQRQSQRQISQLARRPIRVHMMSGGWLAVGRGLPNRKLHVLVRIGQFVNTPPIFGLHTLLLLCRKGNSLNAMSFLIRQLTVVQG